MISLLAVMRNVVPTLALVAFAAAADPSLSPNSSADVARIIAPPPSYLFHNSRFVYSVHWQFFNAGTSTVSLQPSRTGLRVAASADSAGFPDKLYHVHDVFNAEVNTKSFCTSHVRKHNEEGPHRRDINVALDYTHAKSRVEVTDLKTSESKHLEFDIPPCVTDVVSGFYYVASLPLAPGFSQVFPVNDNGKTSDIRLDVEGREKVKGPSGEYQTLRVKLVPIAGAMKGKGTLWVWFTEDPRHMPVQMKSKLSFATLSFQMQSAEPHPK